MLHFTFESALLYYRPVYAFEYAWRDKRGVVEIDALTGNVNKEGSMLVSKARDLMTRETLLDIGAELANSLVPGGGCWSNWWGLRPNRLIESHRCLCG